MGVIGKNNKGQSTYKYSEIFHSFQGEGEKTGMSTAWIRFFLCNLSCSGFSQPDPTDPSTYILPFEDFDLTNIKTVEELPVFDRGCDSSYTWSARFKHLMKNNTATEICNLLEDSFKNPTNPQGRFLHPQTKQWTHLAFTGGEPMLNQPAMVEITQEFWRRKNFPNKVTVETNGTKKFKPDKGDTGSLDSLILAEFGVPAARMNGREWFWSVSPKLWSTAGEKPKKAIQPAVVGSYAEMSDRGQLKYVVNGTSESWKEVEEHTKLFRAEGVNWPVFIMGVGATKESQEEGGGIVAEIAMEAIKRGYNFSGRLHCSIFGNAIGT